MPGEHRDLYISTTLSIVIFTTVVCGGLTEPMLNRMGMRMSAGPLPVGEAGQYEVRRVAAIGAGGGGGGGRGEMTSVVGGVWSL